jgi:predicted ribosome quality control (RQC) complex YloA/Tae2 family protein
MNSYYALIYLNAELKAKLSHYLFVKAITSRKNTLDLFFQKDGDDIKLTVSLTHGSTAVFTDPRISHRSSNITGFFESLSGKKMTASELAEGDRLLALNFEDGSKLMIKLFGSRSNVLLVRNGIVVDSFKDAAGQTGKPAPESKPPASVAFRETSGELKKRIFRTWPYLQRHMVPDIISKYQLEDEPDEVIESILNEIDYSARNEAEFRLLREGRFCIIPEKHLPLENEQVFDNVDDAIRTAFFKGQSSGYFAGLRQSIERTLSKEMSRLVRLADATENAVMSLDRAEKYEQYGNLLMAFSHLKQGNSENITLENFYDEGHPITIPINPELSLAANASHYFEKKKKAERSYEVQIRQNELVSEKLKIIKQLIDKFDKCRDIRELNDFSKKLAAYGLSTESKNQAGGESRPFSVTRFGSYEIWIGRNAKSNDAIVREAHKDDIWLHARGVSGSHVLIRMNKRTHEPDKNCLETAASWAAWKSKAKGSKMVPVIWTRRKFVRKPKGAPTGTVLVDKENVILAEPIEPDFYYIGV